MKRRPLIHIGTCRRPEQQRIGNNRAAQQARNPRFNLHTIFLIHLIDDGRSTANRLIAEKYRRNRFHRSQPVVVDDFQNLGALHAFHRLAPLIMVHQDDPFALGSQQVPA